MKEPTSSEMAILLGRFVLVVVAVVFAAIIVIEEKRQQRAEAKAEKAVEVFKESRSDGWQLYTQRRRRCQAPT